MSVNKGACGLKEVGDLDNYQLKQHLAPHGHTPSKQTMGLWKHNSTKKMFSLVVDNFGVKYFIKNNANRLINALKEKIEDAEVKWEGDKLYGINLK